MKTSCKVSCGISAMFLIGMIFMTLTVDKSTMANDFKKTLDESLKEKYADIVVHRRNIYFTGFLLGFILSLVVISWKTYNNVNLSPLILMCTTGAITFVTTYFYYILSPKKDYMVRYLFKKEQREEWLNINRNMSIKYHGGLLLGLLSVIGFSYGIGS